MSKTSLWSLVCKLPPERVNNLYPGVPKIVRHILAEWLENQPWEFLDFSDTFCVNTARNLVTSMAEELRNASRGCGNSAHVILQYVNSLEDMCEREPQRLVEIFKGILEREKAAVLVEEKSLPMSYYLKQEELKFGLAVQNMVHKLGEVRTLQDRLKQADKVTALDSQKLDVNGIKVKWAAMILEAVTFLENLQLLVLKRVHIWKRLQQLSGNGAPFNEDLAPLQEKCEILFDIHIQLSQELLKACPEMRIEAFADVPERLNNSLRTLVKSSFLVEKQPPQVLKTQTKFQASVRFLLGQKLLASLEKMPVVRATIITEKQAREMVQNHNIEGLRESAGEIVNNTAPLENHQSSKAYGATFKNLSVKKIKRCERKGSESVTEEKCAVLFLVQITFSAINMSFQLEALSLPLVVIVHGNQDNNAKATILWDNAFSEVERIPFIVAERVPWPKMCETLNLRFVSEVGTNQGLQKHHYFFLAQKVFNDNTSKVEDFQKRTVSWSQFNKELLPGRGFTFWQWFDGVVELSKKCLKNYWSDKLIFGFISKQYVHKFLSSQADGTFLLRFSDSEIGGITIAHILRNMDGAAQIQNIQPFSAHDLGIRTLGDRIRDLMQLKFLYDHSGKDEAFQKHYTKQGLTKTDGYTPAIIKMEVSNDQSTSQQSSATIQQTPDMGARLQDSPSAPAMQAMHSPMYAPSPNFVSPCYPNPDNVTGPQMPQTHMQSAFHISCAEVPQVMVPMASPPRLRGTCGPVISESPPHAYSPGGGMSPGGLSPYPAQYPEQMQVDPQQFRASMMDVVISGSPVSYPANEMDPTLHDIIDEFLDHVGFPVGVAPAHHYPQNRLENDSDVHWVE